MPISMFRSAYARQYLPSLITRAKWTQTKHNTIRKARVLQNISVFEVVGCCFEASFPRSFISLGFFSISERCKVPRVGSESAAIFLRELVTSLFPSKVGRSALGKFHGTPVKSSVKSPGNFSGVSRSSRKNRSRSFFRWLA